MHPRIRLPVFVAALLAFGDAATSPLSTGATPETALLVTRHIENFWDAYDAGGREGRASAFQEEYLDRASPGLRDFIGLRQLTAASLADMVRRYPRYFADIRPNTLRLVSDPALQGSIRQSYRRIGDLYPAAVFPPVYFLIGRFSTGGTVGQSGMLVGARTSARPCARSSR